MNKNDRTFKNVAIGQTFYFVGYQAEESDLIGPWIKVSAKCYHKPAGDDSKYTQYKFTVGSIYVKVQ